MGLECQNSPKEDILKILKTAKVKYPVMAGGSAPGGTGTIPHVCVFDTTGKLVWNGNPHDEDFERAVKKELRNGQEVKVGNCRDLSSLKPSDAAGSLIGHCPPLRLGMPDAPRPPGPAKRVRSPMNIIIVGAGEIGRHLASGPLAGIPQHLRDREGRDARGGTRASRSTRKVIHGNGSSVRGPGGGGRGRMRFVPFPHLLEHRRT